MAAAMRILDGSPAKELSLRMVAREAGVAAPSVYAHFPDARTMMAEIVRECWRELGEEMSRAATPEDPLRDLLARMAAYVRYALERPSRYQLLFALQPIDVESPPDLPGPVQPAYRNVLGCIERMIEAGRPLPARDAHRAAVLALSIAHGRVALAHTAPYKPGNTPAGVEAFVVEALEQLFAGAIAPA
jgi:AcrR family transcriptional regulator